MMLVLTTIDSAILIKTALLSKAESPPSVSVHWSLSSVRALAGPARGSPKFVIVVVLFHCRDIAAVSEAEGGFYLERVHVLIIQSIHTLFACQQHLRQVGKTRFTYSRLSADAPARGGGPGSSQSL